MTNVNKQALYFPSEGCYANCRQMGVGELHWIKKKKNSIKKKKNNLSNPIGNSGKSVWNS